VIQRDASEDRKTATGAISSGCPNLCRALHPAGLVTARLNDFNSMSIFDRKPTHYSHAIFV
jgi:hypothetical protein